MKSNPTSMEKTSDKEIVITRVFRAPAAIVFDAWTKPEHVRRWWAPKSHGVTLEQCDADVRAGGTYRYVLARGKAERFAFSGKYLEITRPTRLVYTQCFEAFPGAEVVVTVSFEEREGSTRLVSHEVYASREALEGALASGMESGMRETFEQLEELLTALRA